MHALSAFGSGSKSAIKYFMLMSIKLRVRWDAEFFCFQSVIKFRVCKDTVFIVFPKALCFAGI